MFVEVTTEHRCSRMCSWLRRLSLAPLLSLALVACAAQADEGVTVGQATLGNVFLAGEPVRIPVRSTGDSIARSEEHTSELQSLMRISYAVFCLKKKK